MPGVWLHPKEYHIDKELEDDTDEVKWLNCRRWQVRERHEKERLREDMDNTDRHDGNPV